MNEPLTPKEDEVPNDEDKDGCELDFTQHPTSPAEVEDYLIPAGEEEDEDDD